MQLMTQTEYAKRRGINQSRVAAYIRQGKLSKSIHMVNGLRKIDPELADQELEDNLDKTPKRVKAGKARQAKAKGQKEKKPDIEVNKSEKKKKLDAIEDSGIDYQEEREKIPFAEYQRLDMGYRAAMNKIELDLKNRSVIPFND